MTEPEPFVLDPKDQAQSLLTAEKKDGEICIVLTQGERVLWFPIDKAILFTLREVFVHYLEDEDHQWETWLEGFAANYASKYEAYE